MMKKILVIAFSSLLIIAGIIFVNFKLSKKDVKLDETMTEQREENVRQPSVGGTFYPGDPTTLQNKINEFLSSSNDQMDDDQVVKLLIVPHAGYEYSGSVAASGFKQIENKQYDKVILIGSSHQSFFQGAAVDENTVWQSPLGKVDVDVAAAQEIVDADENFNFNSSAHAQEHSLEVQLPFLQTVLDNFKIVPILFGQTTDEDVNKLASTINQLLTPNTLILISTDLSHYPSYDIANSVDERTISSILSGDPEKFEQKVTEQMSEGYPNLDTCVCAEKAVKTAMIVAQNITLQERDIYTAPGAESNWQLLKYANSGDIVGEKNRVVGYAALAFSQKISNVQSSNVQNELKKENKNKLLEIARETLETYVTTGKKPDFEITDSGLDEKLGVFVTLRKDDQLRGCMGKFDPDTPLWETVVDRTIAAAAQDPRFSPVSAEEIDKLTIEISVLSKPEPINDWQKIELGTHGVIVQKGNQAGTYLPQVGVEEDWESVEEFLAHLCANKAGLPIDCYKDPNTELLTYTADVFSE